MDKKILITFITAFIWLGCGTLNAQVRVAEEPLAADSLILPEGMQAHELDSLLNDWNVRSHLTADDSCNATGENPQFTEEEYISRLSRLPNVIEMPYNKEVRRYIDQYCERMRRSISIFLGAGNFYIPLFEEALESYQLPLELKYLPIIESALNPKATSRVGAAGLWQFMIATGKQYGLEVTSLVDERRDPIKSSYAAARYLKDLYDMFGDWTLVIASYNCGPNNTLKAITRAGGVKDYWKIYPYLPAETRGYVPAFIAANYVMNYYCQHNICPLETNLPQSADTLNVTRNVYMEQIVDLCGVSMDEVKALNPQYRTNLIPGESRPCTIKLPSSAVAAFLTAGDSIYTHRIGELAKNRKVVEVDESKASSSSKGARTVTVRKGDTLGSIAQRNRTTVTKIKRLNGLKNNNIRVGQKLRVR
ncbi:MAG: transglycosylase SLT domain-containing protein [Bacteroidaceae bacterium]|nr:transglycosylase SLT domain-containing protein [Bacteroidaceae bacterium]